MTGFARWIAPLIVLAASIWLPWVPKGVPARPQPLHLEAVGQIGGPTWRLDAELYWVFLAQGPHMVQLHREPGGSLREVGRTPMLPGMAFDVDAVGWTAYVTMPFAGLAVVDLDPPIRPQVMSVTSLEGAPLGIEVVDGFAYVAAYDAGLRVVDVRDQAAPREVAGVRTPAPVTDVDYSDGFVYLMSAGYQHPVSIVDVRDPLSPVYVGELAAPDGEGMSAMRAAAVADGFAYGWETGQGLLVFDVADPSRPAFHRFVPGVFGMRVVVEGDRLFTLSEELTVLELERPGDPVYRGELPLDLEWVRDIAVLGPDVFAAADESLEAWLTSPTDLIHLPPGAILTVDAADATSPVVSARYRAGSPVPGPTSLVFRNYAYVSDERGGGFAVYYLGQPSRPRAAGVAGGSGWYSGFATRPFHGVAVANEFVGATRTAGRLETLRLLDPGHPRIEGTVAFDTALNGVAMSPDGQTAFATELAAERGSRVYTATVHIVDISDLREPDPVGRFVEAGVSASVVAIDGHVLLLGSDGGPELRVVDVRDPSRPVLVARVDLGAHEGTVIASIAVRGPYAYVASREESEPAEGVLTTVDLNDPTAPRVLRRTPLAAGASWIAVDADLAYVMVMGGGLHAFDLRQPSMPTHVGVLAVPPQLAPFEDFIFDARSSSAGSGHQLTGFYSHGPSSVLVVNPIDD